MVSKDTLSVPSGICEMEMKTGITIKKIYVLYRLVSGYQGQHLLSVKLQVNFRQQKRKLFLPIMVYTGMKSFNHHHILSVHFYTNNKHQLVTKTIKTNNTIC